MIVSRVRIVRFAAVLSAIAFAACSADAPNAVPSAGESTAGTTASAVPATRATHPDTTAAWQGDLPCADCPAIRSTLVLYPDGVFLHQNAYIGAGQEDTLLGEVGRWMMDAEDRKSTRLNSSHVKISYAVFCLKKKKDTEP